MLQVEGDGFDAPLLEAAMWGLTGVLAVRLARRTPPGSRFSWWLLAAAMVLIVLDKTVDIYVHVHALGTAIATLVDPVEQLRGPHAVYRDMALAAIFVAGCAALAWLLRRDQMDRAKVLSFSGIVVVFGLLVLRLVPSLQDFLPDFVTKAIELAAWLMVLSGERLALRPPPQRRVRPDGFV